MVWVRHDDTYSDRPAIAALSDAAFRDHFRLVEYVCRYVTDGRIPKAITDRVATFGELVAAGLYEVGQGYSLLRGWREHALPSESVEKLKCAGRAGGLAKARAKAKAKALPSPSPSPSPVPAPERTSVPSERVLFAGAPSTVKKPKKLPDPRVQSLKVAWLALYSTATGEAPATFNHGAWGSLCRVALKAHDEPTILARANAFFGSQRAKMQAFRFEAFFKDFATLNGKPKARDVLGELGISKEGFTG